MQVHDRLGSGKTFLTLQISVWLQDSFIDLPESIFFLHVLTMVITISKCLLECCMESRSNDLGCCCFYCCYYYYYYYYY